MKNCCAVLAIVVLTGCGANTRGGGAAPTLTVHPGESIQAAINAAPANATIVVQPGVYHESAGAPSAVVISKDGVELIGQSTPGHPVVLENSGGQMNGIVVSPTDSSTISNDEHPGEHPPCGENGHLIHDFTLQGFTVRGFDQFGVYLACVDGFILSQNFTDADRLYGLFPVRSHNGMMSNNEAHGGVPHRRQQHQGSVSRRQPGSRCQRDRRAVQRQVSAGSPCVPRQGSAPASVRSRCA